jgi:hypothetical protein
VPDRTPFACGPKRVHEVTGRSRRDMSLGVPVDLSARWVGLLLGWRCGTPVPAKDPMIHFQKHAETGVRENPCCTGIFAWSG